MKNSDIAEQIQEDIEIYGLSWRSAPIFEARRIMAEKGLRNIDIAERLGVSEANISRLLRGDQNLKIETLHLLAAAIEERLEICFGERNTHPIAPRENKETYEFEYLDSVETWPAINILRGLAMNDEKYGRMEVANEGSVAFG